MKKDKHDNTTDKYVGIIVGNYRILERTSIALPGEHAIYKAECIKFRVLWGKNKRAVS